MVTIEWYVLRTICGKEEAALTLLRKRFAGIELIYPRRRISWRKQGTIISLVRPLFEGYLFVAYPQEKIGEFDYLLRRCDLKLVWLVYSTGTLIPILEEEKCIIQQLIGKDGIVEGSTVENHDGQLQVIKGPLAGLGHIVKKVSRRNRRITVEIPVLDEKKNIELEGIFKDG
ncbi:transcription termination factor nusg [Lucifera butyrica]|uniref:Transcription termination factor nusg n=1 Tax=Lucifera butyrica TaxID=1351585 RepID=A0A498R4L3_9FIRM|nr:transcription termination/antitermination NusG family protein [Lucifera butyrica]VBB05123.1 transcription termination factor nusg [Lucifera butyrica]